MPIYLRQDLTTRLIRDRYDDVDGLAQAWVDTATERTAFPKPRQRATIYRWLSDGVPSRDRNAALQLYGFCALLDVDLLTIFDYERNGYFSKFARLRQSIYTGLLRHLEPVIAMYRPADNWPSDALALACYDRPWFGHSFSNENDWDSKDYVLVKASFSMDAGAAPRAVHIAYRRLRSPDTMWRYYGTVLSIDGMLLLYNEGGGHQKMDQVEKNEIRFRTYFGGRPVEWRLASLHDFTCALQYPFNEKTTIGFEW